MYSIGSPSSRPLKCFTTHKISYRRTSAPPHCMTSISPSPTPSGKRSLTTSTFSSPSAIPRRAADQWRQQWASPKCRPAASGPAMPPQSATSKARSLNSAHTFHAKNCSKATPQHSVFSISIFLALILKNATTAENFANMPSITRRRNAARCITNSQTGWNCENIKMPIRPENKKWYPQDWKKRSFFIRFIRAKNRCEWCGAQNYEPHPITGSIVVLTTAHIFENIARPHQLLNLAALCQRCHNHHDAKMRSRHSKERRERNQLKLNF